MNKNLEIGELACRFPNTADFKRFEKWRKTIRIQMQRMQHKSNLEATGRLKPILKMIKKDSKQSLETNFKL